MTLTEVLTSVQTAIFLGGVVVGIRQMLLLSKQIGIMSLQLNHELEWQKKNVSFEYMKKFSSHMKATLTSLQSKIDILKQDGNQKSISDMYANLEKADSRMELYETVSYFEHMAIGIEEDYFDEAILKKAQHNVVVSTYSLLWPYLLLRRNETKVRVGAHFERLAKRWSEDKS